MGKSVMVTLLCVSFLGGVAIRSFFFVSPLTITWVAGGIFGTLCVLFFSGRREAAVVALCVLFALGGMYRYQQKAGETNTVRVYNEGDTQEIKGVVFEEPDMRSRTTQLVVNAREVREARSWRTHTGNVLVITEKFPIFHYGDEVHLRGKLSTPEVFNSFDYPGYLRERGIFSVMYYPRIEKRGEGGGNDIYRLVLSAKRALRASIESQLVSPHSELLLGILLGDQKRLPEDVVGDFNETGTRHIMAVSGMNLTLVSQICLFSLLGIGLWRRHAFFVTLGAIAFFIVFVGMSASVVRAGLMAGVLLLSQHMGRPRNAERAILYAAFLMVFHNPLILRFDIGFQLSFFSTLGIILFTRPLDEFLRFIPERFSLREISSMTLASQGAAVPLAAMYFGTVSLVSFPANLLIAPVIAPVTIAGFLLGVGGMVSGFMTFVIQPIVWVLLEYIIRVVHVFSEFPFASLRFSLGGEWLGLYYGSLFFIWRKMNRKNAGTSY